MAACSHSEVRTEILYATWINFGLQMVNPATVAYPVRINHEAPPDSKVHEIIFPLTTPYYDCSTAMRQRFKSADI